MPDLEGLTASAGGRDAVVILAQSRGLERHAHRHLLAQVPHHKDILDGLASQNDCQHQYASDEEQDVGEGKGLHGRRILLGELCARGKEDDRRVKQDKEDDTDALESLVLSLRLLRSLIVLALLELLAKLALGHPVSFLLMHRIPPLLIYLSRVKHKNGAYTVIVIILQKAVICKQNMCGHTPLGRQSGTVVHTPRNSRKQALFNA